MLNDRMAYERGPCPACFVQDACYLKMTKRGTWWWRCRSCQGNGFVNSPEGWRAFRVSEAIANIMSEKDLVAVLEGPPDRIEKLMRARVASTERPAPVEVSND